MKFLNSVLNAGRRLNAPLAGFPGLELTGSTVSENLNDSDLQVRTVRALQERFDFDIVFPMMDLTVEAEALGAEIDWKTDEMPSIRGILVNDMTQAEALEVPEIGEGNRLGVFVRSCAGLRKAFPQKLVWGYVLGPFSIAGRLMGMTEIAVATKLDPDVVHRVLETCSSLLEKYIDAILETGVDGIMILEPASSMLRADDADEFSNAYIRRLVDRIKAAGKTPSLHNCGKVDHMIENLCATGIEALHLGPVSDLKAIYPRLPENVVLMGNIDPAGTLLQGTPDDVRKAVCTLLDRMADYDRFVLSSGCDVPPGTTLKNMEALAETRNCEAFLSA